MMPVFDGFDSGNTCWVDLTTSDVASATAFYSALFGWQQSEPNAFVFMTVDGKRVAAIGQRRSDDYPVGWNTYIAVDDADATAKAVRDAGGSVVIEPTGVGDTGRFVVFDDSTGARFCVWQAGTAKGVEYANELNTWGYSEVLSSDPEKAMSFYADVFGWNAVSNEQYGLPGWSWYLGEKHLGGLMQEDGDITGWLNYFGVADLDAALTELEKLGGAVVRPKIETPIGWWATVGDPQGALLGLAQMKTQ